MNNAYLSKRGNVLNYFVMWLLYSRFKTTLMGFIKYTNLYFILKITYLKNVFEWYKLTNNGPCFVLLLLILDFIHFKSFSSFFLSSSFYPV